MNAIVLSVTLVFILIALVASIPAALIKFILFRRQKDTYRDILKFGLLGELFGTIIMLAVEYLFKSQIKNLDEPEALLAPLYLMLAGLLIGSIWTYFKRPKAIIN